jgi:hypothetical protein
MFVPIVGLTSLLSQLNGTQSSNLTAGTAASSSTQHRYSYAEAAKLGTTGNAGSPGGVGATSSLADIEATLNQLLQNLRLSASSTNAVASSAAVAQSSGLQHRLLDRARQLAQQGSPHVLVGRTLSAVA